MHDHADCSVCIKEKGFSEWFSLSLSALPYPQQREPIGAAVQCLSVASCPFLSLTLWFFLHWEKGQEPLVWRRACRQPVSLLANHALAFAIPFQPRLRTFSYALFCIPHQSVDSKGIPGDQGPHACFPRSMHCCNS